MIARLDLARAAAALVAGEVVAIPTDTVYGLAASLDRPEAVARIFALKSRPPTTALPVLVDDPVRAGELGVTWDARAAALADAFWPGALTIVVPAPDDVASRVGGRGALGLRQPDDVTARALLARTGPLATTSANEHGEPPCTSAEEVDAVFAIRDGLAGILDDGPRRATVSTVVVLDVDGWRVARVGAVSPAALAGVLDRY